jgi:hypothetical protein
MILGMMLAALLPLTSSAQKNTFIVTVNSTEKVETLYLLSPLDYVSYLCDTVAAAQRNSEGRFVFTQPDSVGRRVIFSAGAQAWAAYTEPAASCTLVLRQGMPDPVVIAPKEGTNAAIAEIRQHSKDLYRRFDNKWDTLFYALDDLGRSYAQHPDSFIRDFADYHFTYKQIDAATHLLRYDLADTLEKRLLRRHGVDYSHPECIQFVQQMALNRMMVHTMRHYCNKPGDEEKTMPIHLLACEMRYYPNDQLRELYMMLGIKLSFQNRFYEDEPAFLEFCNLVLSKVEDPAHKPIAEHLRARYLPK